MREQTLDAHYGASVTLDLCHTCGGFWFDTDESLALSPGAALRLFRVIHEGRGDRPQLGEQLTCPRCRTRLARTFDRQRSTRFTYWRCLHDHGRFITFAEFLREKNFVRPLTAREIAEIRANVRQIRCSSCGAPVDLEQGSTCGHCRAPVSMLDARQVEKVVAELEQAEARRHDVDPALPVRLVLDRAEVERRFGAMALGSSGCGGPGDLVRAGVDALIGLVSARG
jgi:hypothetical protein